MRRWVIALLCLLLLGCRANSTAKTSIQSAQDLDGTLTVGGLTRTYHLHVPAHGAGTMPLLLVLHGRLGTGSGTITLTGMNTLADQQGFIVAYPDGISRSWADGRNATPADQQGVDDVGFIGQLLTTLSQQFPIDARRIYASGISNGGFMTQRLGCELANRLAAIVSVAATLSVNQSTTCTPARPLPILLVLGTSDPLVPYNGGQVSDDHGAALSATDSLAAWAKFAGCTGAPTNHQLPDRTSDGTHASQMSYTTCQGQAQVELFSVQNGGHTWPSGEQYLPVAIVGRTTHQIGNDDLWNFLKQFHLS